MEGLFHFLSYWRYIFSPAQILYTSLAHPSLVIFHSESTGSLTPLKDAFGRLKNAAQWWAGPLWTDRSACAFRFRLCACLSTDHRHLTVQRSVPSFYIQHLTEVPQWGMRVWMVGVGGGVVGSTWFYWVLHSCQPEFRRQGMPECAQFYLPSRLVKNVYAQF